MLSKKYKNGVRVFAPATIGNVGVGFDVLGLAINSIGDDVVITPGETEGVTLKIIGDGGKLPREPHLNTVTVPIISMLKELNLNQALDVTLYKNLPIGSGLGSSAASAVAGAFAANVILREPFAKPDLLRFALEGEKIATGAAHADNVAPCLLGGLVLSRGLKTERIYTPPGLQVVVIHPNIEVLTKDSRSVLPTKIELSKAIEQWGNLAGFLTGMMKGDFKLIKDCLNDVIIEPARAQLIPGFNEVKSAALKMKALGCSISGAGPSIFALCENTMIADDVAKAMQTEFKKLNIESNVFISEVNNEGAQIL